MNEKFDANTPLEVIMKLTPIEWGILVAALDMPHPFIGRENIRDCHMIATKLRAQLPMAK